jgi:hypothetical protein
MRRIGSNAIPRNIYHILKLFSFSSFFTISKPISFIFRFFETRKSNSGDARHTGEIYFYKDEENLSSFIKTNLELDP